MSDREDRARQEIAQRCPDVEFIHRPTPKQYAMWKDVVDWEDGTDPLGWFIGVCPIAKADHEDSHPANYNFHKGVVKCEEMCFPNGRKTVSLMNIIEAIAVNVLRDTLHTSDV